MALIYGPKKPDSIAGAGNAQLAYWHGGWHGKVNFFTGPRKSCLNNTKKC